MVPKRFATFYCFILFLLPAAPTASGANTLPSGDERPPTADCDSLLLTCKNGSVVELLPIDSNGDGSVDSGGALVGAEDLLAAPPQGCPGPFTYSIRRADEAYAPGQASLPLNCEDLGIMPVEIQATDAAGSSGSCATFLLVQNSMNLPCAPHEAEGYRFQIETEHGRAVPGVEVRVSGPIDTILFTDAEGSYRLPQLEGSIGYTIRPKRDGDDLNGISVFDLVLISKHILGVAPLPSPYDRIAADIDSSGNVSLIDLLQLQKLLLGIDTAFTDSESWRFVKENHALPDTSGPWQEGLGAGQDPTDSLAERSGDFIAVKVGDIDNNAALMDSLFSPDDPVATRGQAFTLSTADAMLQPGEQRAVDFWANNLQDIQAYQATLSVAPALEMVELQAGLARPEQFGWQRAGEGLLAMLWMPTVVSPQATAQRLSEPGAGSDGRARMFTLVLKAKRAIRLSEAIRLSSAITTPAAYQPNGSRRRMALRFVEAGPQETGFHLYPNQPNPFRMRTTIPFRLPEAEQVSIAVSDMSGKLLRQFPVQGTRGYNQVEIDSSGLPRGPLVLTIKSGSHTASRVIMAVP